MKWPSKKFVRPTTRTPSEDPDPLGFGRKIAEVYAELEHAYHAGLRTCLLKFLLVRLEPPVLRLIADVGTTLGRPVRFPLTITVHPRDASGFALVVGELDPFYLPLDYPLDPSLTSL